MGKLDGPTIDEVTRREENIRRKQRTKEQNLDLAVKSVFGNKQGRMVLHHILSFCGIYQSTFTGNSSTFFKEGKREVGLRLIDLVGIDTYIETLKENKNG
jgi:hypothetical protein